jgi:hypothetical protein
MDARPDTGVDLAESARSGIGPRWLMGPGASRQVPGQSCRRQDHRRAHPVVRRRAARRAPLGSSLRDPRVGRLTRR